MSSPGLANELRSVQATLARVQQEVLCGVCRELFAAPVVFPCGHTFCSLCARRYMLLNSNCPDAHCKKPATTDQLRPVRALELVTQALSGNTNAALLSDRPRDPRHRPFLVSGATRSMLKDKLGAVGLPVDGTTENLLARYREFVLLWNANLDSAHPRSELTIAERVRRAEQKNNGTNSKSKTRGQKSIAFRKNVAPKLFENDDNPDEPREGDDFKTLMDKVRRRENRPGPGVRRVISSDNAVSGGNNTTSIENTGGNEATANAEAQSDSIQQPSPVHTESATESDLALIHAADHATQSQEQNTTAPTVHQTNEQQNNVMEREESPTESDLLLIEAADQILSQSQEILSDVPAVEDANSMESIPTRPSSPCIQETPPRPAEANHAAQRAYTSPTLDVAGIPARRNATDITPQQTLVPETPQSDRTRRRIASPVIPETPPSDAPLKTLSRSYTYNTPPSRPGNQQQEQRQQMFNQPRRLFPENVQQRKQQQQQPQPQERILQPLQNTQPATQRYGAGHISIGPRRNLQHPKLVASASNCTAHVNNNDNQVVRSVTPTQSTVHSVRAPSNAPTQTLTRNGQSNRTNFKNTQPIPQANSNAIRNPMMNNQYNERTRQASSPLNRISKQAAGPSSSIMGNNQRNEPRPAAATATTATTPTVRGAPSTVYDRRPGVNSAPQVGQPRMISPLNGSGTMMNRNWRQGVSNTTQPSFSQPVTQKYNNTRMQLTQEQVERIERNRQRAVQIQLAKRRRLNQQQSQQQYQRPK